MAKVDKSVIKKSENPCIRKIEKIEFQAGTLSIGGMFGMNLSNSFSPNHEPLMFSGNLWVQFKNTEGIAFKQKSIPVRFLRQFAHQLIDALDAYQFGEKRKQDCCEE